MEKTGSKEEPVWLKRRLNLLKGLMIRADLKESLQEILNEPMIPGANPVLLFDSRYSMLAKKHQIPMDLYPAIEKWTNNDFELSDEEIVRLLDPPVKISAEKGTVMLTIRPNTKKSELRNFIDENITKIEALNRSDTGIEWMYPASLVKRVDIPDLEGEKALEMGAKGQNSPAVIEELGLSGRAEESNIRRKKSKAKKKRTDVH